MDLSEQKNQLIYWAKRCYERRLISATGGNISLRLADIKTMLIKASGISFGDLSPEDLVVADFDGKVLEGSKKLSKEWRFHAGIYKTRPEIMAVIHVHPPYATAIANSIDQLPLETNHAKDYLVDVPTIAPGASGSEILATNVINAYRNSSRTCVLLREHGIISANISLSKAYYFAEMLEDTAQIALFRKCFQA